MRKILIGLAVLAFGVVVVFVARNGLREHARATPEAAATAAAPGAAETTAPAPAEVEGLGEADGAADPDPEAEGAAPTTEEPAAGGESDRDGGEMSASTPAQPSTAAEAQAAADSQDPDIERVLRRAAEIYSKATSLQADFTQRSVNPILRTTVTSSGTLYQRPPDRFLMKFSEPEGDLIVSDGRHFWVYYPSVDRKQVIRMPASMGAGGVDLQAQFVGDPMKRFAVSFEGREEVSGRAAWVLILTPREPVGYQRLKLWIDAGDHLVRRFEVTEESGIVRHFELSNLRLDQKLPDDLFRFEQPEGTHIVDRG